MSQIDFKKLKMEVVRSSTIYIHKTSCLRSLPEDTEKSQKTQKDLVPITQEQMKKILLYLEDKGGKIQEDGTLYTPEPFNYEIEEILELVPITAGYAPHSYLCSHENSEELVSLQLITD